MYGERAVLPVAPVRRRKCGAVDEGGCWAGQQTTELAGRGGEDGRQRKRSEGILFVSRTPTVENEPTNEMTVSCSPTARSRACDQSPSAEVTTLMDRPTPPPSFSPASPTPVREVIGAAVRQASTWAATKGDCSSPADPPPGRIRAEQGISSEAPGVDQPVPHGRCSWPPCTWSWPPSRWAWAIPQSTSAPADPRTVVKALELPSRTFPRRGLPSATDQESARSRMPRSVMTAQNTYPRVESYSGAVDLATGEVTEYYLRLPARVSHLVATNIGGRCVKLLLSWRLSTSRGCVCATFVFS